MGPMAIAVIMGSMPYVTVSELCCFFIYPSLTMTISLPVNLPRCCCYIGNARQERLWIDHPDVEYGYALQPWGNNNDVGNHDLGDNGHWQWFQSSCSPDDICQGSIPGGFPRLGLSIFGETLSYTCSKTEISSHHNRSFLL